ncbi:MAG: L,D-transpeptidase family protein [Clostridia bacterium]|nr:L,D-transpeptidase family protein [Clostridia bacterium]
MKRTITFKIISLLLVCLACNANITTSGSKSRPQTDIFAEGNSIDHYTTTPSPSWVPAVTPTATPIITPTDTPTPTPSPSGTAECTPTGTPTVTNTPVSPTPPITTPPIDIKKINYIEELKKLNYFRIQTKDSNLNLRTAILLFQSDHNLKVDGIWGKQSLSSLIKRMTSTQPFTYTDKITLPPGKDQWIVINKSKRILTLYKKDSVVKKYPIAVGNPPSLTPSGKFTIVNKSINPTWGGGGYAKPVKGGSPKNPLGYRWMGLSPKGGNDYGIHGTNSPYSIGTNASHGCIRMLNPCVEELFPMVKIGIEVWIGTEEELKGWGVVQEAYK